MNAFKKVEIKRFCPLKVSEPTAKVTKRKPTEAAKKIVKTVHYEHNAVAK